MAKLTKAQRECLDIMARNPNSAMEARSTYKPTTVLMTLGFATRRRIPCALHTYTFTITDAGRAALAEGGNHAE